MKLQDLAGSFPGLSNLTEIGESVEERPIYAFEIGNKSNANKPHFILLAGLHGNDFSQPEVGLRFAEMLLQGYGTDADLQWIVDNVEIDLILLANPDGRQVAEGQTAIPSAEPGDVVSIENDNGEDLESNFCVEHLPGQGCESNNYEPETQALLTYLETKFGEPDPAQTPNELARDFFVYFSSHNNKVDTGPLAIGNIRIPWFYTGNSADLSDLTDPALKWQNELAHMLKVLDPDLMGSIEPKIKGDIFPDYPVDYVFRSYGIASLELSAYPSRNSTPLACSRFLDNHPEYYLQVLLNMAKSAAMPYKIGYGPIVDKLTKIETTATEVKYRALIFEKNQIPNLPAEHNPITSVHYYIDQPTGTPSGELTGWEEINTNPYTSGLDFGIPTAGLTSGKHILTLQACSQDEIDNPEGECGLPLSAFLNIPNPDDTDPADPGDGDDPNTPGDRKIYLPLIGR